MNPMGTTQIIEISPWHHESQDQHRGNIIWILTGAVLVCPGYESVDYQDEAMGAVQ